MIVRWSAGGLYDKDFLSTNVLDDFNAGFAITEVIDMGLTQGDSKIGGDALSQNGICVASKDFHVGEDFEGEMRVECVGFWRCCQWEVFLFKNGSFTIVPLDEHCGYADFFINSVDYLVMDRGAFDLVSSLQIGYTSIL